MTMHLEQGMHTFLLLLLTLVMECRSSCMSYCLPQASHISCCSCISWLVPYLQPFRHLLLLLL
jgi:hypothetical protein